MNNNKVKNVIIFIFSLLFVVMVVVGTVLLGSWSLSGILGKEIHNIYTVGLMIFISICTSAGSRR